MEAPPAKSLKKLSFLFQVTPLEPLEPVIPGPDRPNRQTVGSGDGGRWRQQLTADAADVH